MFKTLRRHGKQARHNRTANREFCFDTFEPRIMLHGGGWSTPDDAQIHLAGHDSSLSTHITATSSQHVDAASFVPGEILIKLEGAVANAVRNFGPELWAASSAVGAMGLHTPRVLLDAVGTAAQEIITHWKLPVGADVLETAEQLSHQPGIAFAEPNYIYTASVIPNDSRYSSLYGMEQIMAPAAWDVNTGSGELVVAVIDTGVNYNHPDLIGNIWTNPGEIAGNGLDDDNNGFIDDIHGYDFVNNDGDPMDDEGHGTHVSGTIGAVGNNGTGVVGVNWNVKIMPLKFLDSQGSGSTEDAIEAVMYATMMRQDYGVNVRLTSNSWGGGAFSQLLEDAISLSGQADMLFVAAAGNGGGSVDYPAAYELDNIISVAATDQNDLLASFSDRGEGVDLAAPGVGILSTSGNSYRRLDGTSMATPHVAGAAALVWDMAPNASYDQVRDMLLGSVDVLPGLDVETEGRLNVFEAIKLVEMRVTGSTPAAGDVLDGSVVSPPTDFVIEFSHPIDASTIDASDFTVTPSNGLPVTADHFQLNSDREITFTFNTSPVNVDGPVTMSLLAASIRADSNQYDLYANNENLVGWSDIFFFDSTPLTVSATTPAEGTPALLPLTTLDVAFNQPIEVGSLGIDDLTLSLGSVVSVIPWDVVPEPAGDPVLYEGASYTLEGVDRQGILTYQFATGAVSDLDGNPLAAYTGTAEIDIDSLAFGLPFAGLAPAGSQIYRSSASGVLGHAGDVDQFTITVDGDQALSVVVRSEEGLSVDVSIEDGTSILGTASSGPETPAIIQTIGVPTGGQSYTISVSQSAGTGNYSLDLVLNAVVDNESNHNPATAQSLSTSWMSLSADADRIAVSGSLNSGIPPITAENETGDNFLSKQNDLRGSWFDSGTTTTGGVPIWRINDGAGVTGRIGDRSGSGPLASTDDQDTYYFAALAGDVITVSSTAFSVDLHDDTEAQLIESTSGSFTYEILADGEYWIHVYSGRGDYTLTMDMATPEDMTSSIGRLDYYSFDAAPGDIVRLAADTHASRSAVTLTLFENGVALASSTPTDLLDAFIEYAVPAGANNPTTYKVEITATSETPSEFDVDYGIMLTRNALLDVERNDSPSNSQSLGGDSAGVVVGRLSDTDVNVLWVGSTTLEDWNDGTFNATQVVIEEFPANLTGYDLIYVDSNAGVPSPTVAAAIAAFVSGGGGLVTENGGAENAIDFSWVPNGADLEWLEQLDDDNRLTDLGKSHPVTAGITDAQISNWQIGQHNIFTAVGDMDVLGTNAMGEANILAGAFNNGRLVYLGFDADGHRTKGEAHRLIRQSARWAANTPAESDYFSIDLAVGDVLSLSATAVAASTLEPGLVLHTPSGAVIPPPEGFSAAEAGTYFIEINSSNGEKGDYVLTWDLTTGPSFSVDDVTVVEGASGDVTNHYFTVTLSEPADSLVTVDFEIQDGTATILGNDYSAPFTMGTLNFPFGVTSQTIDFSVIGDDLDEGNEEFTVMLSNASAGSTIFDAMGVATIQDDDQTTSGATYQSDTAMVIPDDKSTNLSPPIYIPFDMDFPAGAIISDVNVVLDISHTRTQDLDVYLVAPNGQRIMLMTDVGGNGQNFSNTTFDDEAPISIVDGSAPFGDEYQPEELLSQLDGLDASQATGNWYLEITDDSNKGNQNNAIPGTLNHWSITIETALPSGRSIVTGLAEDSLDLGNTLGWATWVNQQWSAEIPDFVSISKSAFVTPIVSGGLQTRTMFGAMDQLGNRDSYGKALRSPLLVPDVVVQSGLATESQLGDSEIMDRYFEEHPVETGSMLDDVFGALDNSVNFWELFRN